MRLLGGGRSKHWTRRRRVIGLALIAALALASVGGGLVAAAGARSSKTPVVINEEFKYRPGTFHVKAGTKIVFQNQSSYTHTATDKGTFDTGKIKPGASAQIILKKKGTYVFHCLIHPFMTGKVIVE